MRIRSIKPEFWRSDDIDALSIPDRLLFIGLWSYVDDSGVGIDKEAAVAADLFAGDLAREPQETSVRVHGGLKRLAERGLITRYAVNGRRYLHITKWSDHQRINRPSEARFPGPTSKNAEPQAGGDDDSVSTPADAESGAVEQWSSGGTASVNAVASTNWDEGFDDFWSVWPRKVAKEGARKAYRAARRRGAPASRIRAAAEKHAQGWQLESKPMKWIPHPATWLNEGRYDDEVENPNQTVLSVVPDLPVSVESLRERAAGPAARQAANEAAVLIGDGGFIPDRPRPRDSQLSELEWMQHLAREFIDDHAAEIRAALERKAAG